VKLVKINAGVHWGGALYLGQVITGGRLEVTALGDEVNECARIQQSARDGALLASKPLVERLDRAVRAELHREGFSGAVKILRDASAASIEMI